MIRHASGALIPARLDRRFRPPVTAEEKAPLREYYRPHNVALSGLLGLDLDEFWSGDLARGTPSARGAQAPRLCRAGAARKAVGTAEKAG